MKYYRRQAISPQQQAEIYPIIDKAMELPFGKGVVLKCTAARANYLARVIAGEVHRNAIESLVMYTPDDPTYGKGLYYNIVAEPLAKGLVVARVEHPPESIVWQIIRCAATRAPVKTTFPAGSSNSRLNRLKERHPDILGNVYFEPQIGEYRWAVPSEEELIVVDIDTDPGILNRPTKEDKAKVKSN